MGSLATSRKIQKLKQQTFREGYQTNIFTCIVKSSLVVHYKYSDVKYAVLNSQSFMSACISWCMHVLFTHL